MAKIDKLIEKSREHLQGGEEIKAVVMGSYETKILGQDSVRNGILIMTQNRIVFYGTKMLGGYEMEAFPVSKISSIEMGKGILGHSVTFFSSGNKCHMKWIKEGDVPQFIKLAQLEIGKEVKPISSSVSGMDIPDQIRKLSDLKDKGILTEDEFSGKKTELLSRL